MNGPSNYQKSILGAMQGKHIYGGTVSEDTIKRRRSANKVARRQRKKNCK